MLKPKPSYRLRDEAQVPTRPTSIMLNSWRRTRGLKMIDLLGPHRGRFATVLADPPWRFNNRTGKVAPEHRRLSRYGTMSSARS